MRKAGLTVKFTSSKRVESQISGIVRDNVDLITSIPRQYLDQVHKIVLESVKRGRDMGYITKSLQERFGVARNRAILISRDQTNKATEAVSRARCADIGITHAIWMHRSGPKVPRPTHKYLLNGQTFDLEKGLYDPQAVRLKGGGFRGQWVKTGELVNCGCTYRLDISTVGAGMAADSRFGVRCLVYPAATVEWRAAA